MHALQVLGDAVGDMTGIADESEIFFAATEHVAHGINGIVKDGKTLHGDIADGKGLTGFEGVPVRLDARFAQYVGGRAGGVEGNVSLLEQGFQTAHVIAVFVGDEDAIDGFDAEFLGARD